MEVLFKEYSEYNSTRMANPWTSTINGKFRAQFQKEGQTFLNKMFQPQSIIKFFYSDQIGTIIDPTNKNESFKMPFYIIKT